MEVKSVFILGAGASVAAGGPTMRNFFTRVDRTKRDARWAANSFAKVARARGKLQGALGKFNINIHNIEDLFTTFEMASLISRLNALPEEEVDSLPTHLRYVIMRTIEHCIQFEANPKEQFLGSPFPYDAFVQLLLQLSQDQELGPVAILSFNYDLSIDYAFALADVHVNYGLTQTYRAQEASATATTHSISQVQGSKRGHPRSSFFLLKPHGSLNWFVNDSSGGIDARQVNPFPVRDHFYHQGTSGEGYTPVDIVHLTHDRNIRWGDGPRPEPVIVPPSWNKEKHQQTLRMVWQKAAEVLATAENIFVIGYSLPPSDQFFRAFLALSTVSDAIIQRFWIFDPGDVSGRYDELVGPAISGPGYFRHERMEFTEAIRFLARHLDRDVSAIESLLRKSF
jgi:hypothetical protein